MRALVLHEDYSREEVHDIFDPDTKFTPQAGTWGLHGIVKIPGRPGDFIFFVTFGRQQADHTFDEGITADGVLRWQSQPKQGFADADIGTLIAHDETKHSIYLFLRTAAKRVGVSTDYTYMGRLKYLVHDRDREKPVYFTWQILDWPLPIQVKERMGLRFEGGSAQAESITGDRREAFGLVETSPPVRSDRRAGVHTPRYIGRLRGDPSEQDAKNRQLGLAGELTVVEHEKRALIAAGREDLAERVVHVSLIEGDARSEADAGNRGNNRQNGPGTGSGALQTDVGSTEP